MQGGTGSADWGKAGNSEKTQGQKNREVVKLKGEDTEQVSH